MYRAKLIYEKIICSNISQSKTFDYVKTKYRPIIHDVKISIIDRLIDVIIYMSK